MRSVREPMANSIGNRNVPACSSNMYLANNTDGWQMDVQVGSWAGLVVGRAGRRVDLHETDSDDICCSPSPRRNRHSLGSAPHRARNTPRRTHGCTAVCPTPEWVPSPRTWALTPYSAAHGSPPQPASLPHRASAPPRVDTPPCTVQEHADRHRHRHCLWIQHVRDILPSINTAPLPRTKTTHIDLQKITSALPSTHHQHSHQTRYACAPLPPHARPPVKVVFVAGGMIVGMSPCCGGITGRWMDEARCWTASGKF